MAGDENAPRKTLPQWETILTRRECDAHGHDLDKHQWRRLDGVTLQTWACGRGCGVEVALSYPETPNPVDGLYTEHEARRLLDRYRCEREGHDIVRAVDWSGWTGHEVKVCYQNRGQCSGLQAGGEGPALALDFVLVTWAGSADRCIGG